MAKRVNRDPYGRTVVRVPEQPLADTIVRFAAPMTEPLGPKPEPDEVRPVLELAIALWNGLVFASPVWECPDPKPLAAVQKKMTGPRAAPGHADLFERQARRWRTEFDFDPRLVGAWSFESSESGRPELVCQAKLPLGVEAHVPPPITKRVAIGGKFLDEVQIRQSATALLSFPVDHHRGLVGSDGAVTIHSKMPTVVALFAAGLLPPVGGPPVEVVVVGRTFGKMVLREVGCAGDSFRGDVAVLSFRPASPEVGG
jgi:hypothetical protein